ncbi:MAG: hypothetical protein JNL85_17580 [Rubrivivax sp.]|nr:hypothetical protein [Rubrivivax sp.]
MKKPLFDRRDRALHAVAAVASFAMAAAVMLVVLAAFDSVSREPFLRDSREARAAVARCDARGDRAARERCVRRLIAAAKASDADAARIARVAALEPERRER